MSTRTHTMRGLRRVLGVAVAVILACTALAACGGDGGSGGNEGGDKTLTVWGSRSYYLTEANVAKWNELHPDIKLETQIVDSDDILERMLRAQDAGQPLPDVIQDDIFLLQAYVDAGLVVPLDDQFKTFAEDDAELYKQLLPIVWEEPTRDGKIYGAAVTANFDILYYNKAWFEEAGVSPPFQTYEDLYQAAVKLKAARPKQIPFVVQALAGEGVTALKTVMIGAGTPFNGATPDLRSPGGQYAIEFFQRMRREGLLPPEAIAWGEAEARGAFVNGGGMIIDGFSTAGDFSAIKDFAYDKQWANTLMPIDAGTGQQGSRPTSSRMWAVSSGADTDTAFEFVKFLSSTDYLVPQVEAGGVPPRNSAALDDPKVTAFWPFFTTEIKQGFLDSTGIPSALNAGDVEDVLEKLWGEIVTGADQTPAQLADKYQPQLDALKE